MGAKEPKGHMVNNPEKKSNEKDKALSRRLITSVT
jgi:hypothetical protein